MDDIQIALERYSMPIKRHNRLNNITLYLCRNNKVNTKKACTLIMYSVMFRVHGASGRISKLRSGSLPVSGTRSWIIARTKKLSIILKNANDKAAAFCKAHILYSLLYEFPNDTKDSMLVIGSLCG